MPHMHRLSAFGRSAAMVVAAFALAEFTGEERHVRRLAKITAIEAEFAKG